MKRLIKLLLIIPLLFIVSISAKEIDMQGNEFAQDKLYESGDLYKNVYIKNNYAGFYTPISDLLYYTYRLNGDSFSARDKIGYPGNNVYNVFYPRMHYGKNIFNIIEDQPTQFIIPYILNDVALWSYRNSTRVSSDTAGSSVNDNIGYYSEPNPVDDFMYVMNKPYYTVECGSDVKYGESTTCNLYLNIDAYGKKRDVPQLFYYLMNTDLSFKINSEDYELYNVRVNEDTRFTYNNGVIAGQLFDFTNLRNLDFSDQNSKIDQQIIDEYKKHGTLTNTCDNYDIDESERESYGIKVPINSIENNDNICVPKNMYMIKVLTFDITPLNNETKDGIISLSDMDIVVSLEDEEGNKINISGKIDELDDTIVPMISTENVKGVEENPKTGLFNYLLLIIPAILLGIGFNLLRKINVFKKL